MNTLNQLALISKRPHLCCVYCTRISSWKKLSPKSVFGTRRNLITEVASVAHVLVSHPRNGQACKSVQQVVQGIYLRKGSKTCRPAQIRCTDPTSILSCTIYNKLSLYRWKTENPWNSWINWQYSQPLRNPIGPRNDLERSNDASAHLITNWRLAVAIKPQVGSQEFIFPSWGSQTMSKGFAGSLVDLTL